MLNNKEFDLWAESYDQSVDLSNENEKYPFAGYGKVLDKIYIDISYACYNTVLDIGFGTGRLAWRLYEKGCRIFGQDFSDKMIEISQRKMPCANLYRGDFTQGLVEDLKQYKYDAIIATYSLHHLKDENKVDFIKSLFPLLKDDGCIYIGDVAFDTREELEKCREKAGAEWADDEFYFVFEEMKKSFPKMKFEKMSFCGGILLLSKI